MQMSWSLVSLWEWLSTGRQRAAPCTAMFNWQCTYCTGCLVCLLTSWIAMYITSPCTAMYNWQWTMYMLEGCLVCLLASWFELQCTIDKVHNMYFTLRGCFACCFLNCNVHYRKSDRPTGRPGQFNFLLSKQTATNNQMHVGGQSCQPQENWPPCVPAKKKCFLESDKQMLRWLPSSLSDIHIATTMFLNPADNKWFGE